MLLICVPKNKIETFLCTRRHIVASGTNDLILILGFQPHPSVQIFLNVKSILLIKVRCVLIVRMLGDIIFIM